MKLVTNLVGVIFLSFSSFLFAMERTEEAEQETKAEASRVPALTQLVVPAFFELCNKNNVDATTQTGFPKDKLLELIEKCPWAKEILAPVVITHKDTINSVCFSQDSKNMLTASFDKTIRVSDLQTRRALFQEPQQGSFSKAEYSADSKRILIRWGAKFQLLNAQTGAPVTSLALKSEIVDALFSSDSTVAVVAAGAHALLLNALTGEVLFSINHQGIINLLQMSPDSSKIVTAATNITDGRSCVKITDIKSKNLISSIDFGSGISSVEWSADSKKVIVATIKGEVKISDAATGRILAQADEKNYIRTAFFSYDPNKIVIVYNKEVKILDITDNKFILTINDENDAIFVREVQYSPDCKKMAIYSNDVRLRKGIIKVVDIQSGITSFVIEHAAEHNWLAFSPDSTKIATASHDKTSQVVDMETGTVIAKIAHANKQLNLVRFSPDSLNVVTASVDGMVKITSLRRGDELIRYLQNYSLQQMQERNKRTKLC